MHCGPSPTSPMATHPAPEVDRILGNLKNLGSILQQLSSQLAPGLMKSLRKYDVTEYEGKDPAANVALAGEHLARAAELAEQMGEELAKAQEVITGQGYRSGKALRHESNGG